MGAVTMVAAAKYQQPVDRLTRQLLAELKDQIHSIVLFGSVARGEATDDSDVDVLNHLRFKLEDEAEDQRDHLGH